MPQIKTLTYVALAIIGALFIYQFGFKKSAQALAQDRLETLQAQIEKRGDGSWLLFDEPKIVGKTLMISNVQYQDGARNVILQSSEVSIDLQGKKLANIDAKDIEIIPNMGSALYISTAKATGVRIDSAPVTFEQLALEKLNLEGNITSSESALLNIDKAFLNGVNEKMIDSIVFETVSLTSNRITQGFEVDSYQLTNIKRESLENDLEALRQGQIPITIFPLDNPKIAEGLSALITDGLASGETNEFQQDLYGLFSKYAPQEMRDLLGNPDAQTLGRQIEEFQKLPPKEQAIRGLELLLQGLQSQKGAEN